MNASNIKEEWQRIIKQKLNGDADIEDFQIQVQPPKGSASALKKEETINFYMNRVRHRNEEKKVNLETEKKSTSNTANNKSLTFPNGKNGVMSPQLKERENSKKDFVNVEEQSSKKNVQIYKKSIFGTHSPMIPSYVPKPPQKSAFENSKKFKTQMKTIQDMNKPRWVDERNSRNERNRQKYPNSNTYSYQQPVNSKSKNGLPPYNNRDWFLHQRSQQEQMLKKKEKEQKEQQQERQKRHSQKKKRERQKQAGYQQLFQDMMGMVPTKKIKNDIAGSQGNPNNDNNNNQTLHKSEIIEQINAEDQDQSQSNRELDENHLSKGRQTRYGLRDIIKPYQSFAPNFIRIVLSHNYGQAESHPENKKIPEIFQEEHMYKKVFHYLITNECIADLSQRLKAIKKDSSQPMSITITNIRTNNEGLIEIYMKEKGKDGVFQLKNISLSKYRLGLVVSQSQYSRQMYGVPSKIKNQFAFLALLVTPQTKEDLNAEVRSLAFIKSNQLQFIMRSRKNRQAYFFDLDKLTTHVREYLAVTNLKYSELSPAVFDPRILQKEVGIFVDKKEVLNDILQHLRSIFNQTQWQSIRQMALREKGFVLLQGPPGTGKTSTLMGLLSAQYEYLKKTGDSRKIMICAPSNAAVNHIVKRIQCEGLFNGNGEIFHPRILRVGIVETMDTDIRAVSLDQLCQKQLLESQEDAKRQSKMTTPQIKQAIISVQKQIRKLKIHNKDKEISEKQAELIKYQRMLFTFRKQKVVISRRNYINIECQLLNKAEIILTTLSSTGNDKLDRIRGEIACLIVDQAAQATEPNLLIALQTGVDKVILIGDPYQLPATCMSTDSNITLFNRSLFQRFLDSNIKPFFLNFQYRMAPLIRQFPSSRFYQDRLLDSESIFQRSLPEFLTSFDGRNVCFLDIKYGQEGKIGDSNQNREEARAIGILISRLFDKSVSLGVITPYQAQRRRIIKDCQKQMRDRQQDKQLVEKNVMINTVDSFQGQEKDIIIVSTVRANNRNEVGFLVDERRINVTLTRSKYLLLVVGNGNTLGSNQVWNQFLERVEQKKCYYEVYDSHLLDKVINQMFEKNNKHSISRKRHTQLSADIRKIQRSQIQSKDFKVKKIKSENTSTQDMFNPISEKDNHQYGENSKSRTLLQTTQSYSYTKYALDIKQSQKILEQKKRLQKQANQCDQMHLRIRKLQEQARNNGYNDFLSQLLS